MNIFYMSKTYPTTVKANQNLLFYRFPCLAVLPPRALEAMQGSFPFPTEHQTMYGKLTKLS